MELIPVPVQGQQEQIVRPLNKLMLKQNAHGLFKEAEW